MRRGVLGGTFNPVHYGHLRAAAECMETMGLDHVVFVPAGTPPLKAASLAPAEHRLQMVRLAVEGNPAFSVSDLELRREDKSYTIDTVRQFKALYPGDEVVFIIGIDAFLDMPKWKEPEAILAECSLAVASRPGYSFTQLAASPFLGPEALPALGALGSSEWPASASIPIKGVEAKYLTLVQIDSLPISATHIRALRARGFSTRYLLPESVRLFIITNKLYAD